MNQWIYAGGEGKIHEMSIQSSLQYFLHIQIIAGMLFAYHSLNTNTNTYFICIQYKKNKNKKTSIAHSVWSYRSNLAWQFLSCCHTLVSAQSCRNFFIGAVSRLNEVVRLKVLASTGFKNQISSSSVVVELYHSTKNWDKMWEW